MDEQTLTHVLMAIKELDSHTLAGPANSWQALVDHGVIEELCQLLINIAPWKDVVRAFLALTLAKHSPDLGVH